MIIEEMPTITWRIGQVLKFPSIVRFECFARELVDSHRDCWSYPNRRDREHR